MDYEILIDYCCRCGEPVSAEMLKCGKAIGTSTDCFCEKCVALLTKNKNETGLAANPHTADRLIRPVSFFTVVIVSCAAVLFFTALLFIHIASNEKQNSRENIPAAAVKSFEREPSKENLVEKAGQGAEANTTSNDRAQNPPPSPLFASYPDRNLLGEK